MILTTKATKTHIIEEILMIFLKLVFNSLPFFFYNTIMSSKISSRSNSKSFKKTKKNRFDNIESPVLRKKFYSALEGDIHRDYIIVLYKFGILLEQKLRNTGGICSINISINTEDLMELRPQINTCVGSEDNCDHIFEILTVNLYRMSNVQLFNLSLVDEFMGRNIILLCLQNIDRFYRDVKNEGFTEVDKGSVMVGVKSILKKEPTFKTKYMQGFYRVELIFIIISRLLARKSPKFNNLKKVLLPTKEVIRQVHNTISRNSFILAMMPVRKRVALEKDFRKIRFTDDKVETLENSHYILNTLIDFWVTIHQEILTNYKKEPHELIKYSLPPTYSSSNNEDNRLHLKLGEELGINFESPDGKLK